MCKGRQDVGRRLPWAGMVERPDHDHIGTVSEMVLDAQDVGCGFASRVGVVRSQGAVFLDRQVLRGGIAVADPRAYKNHARPGLQRGGLHGLEQVERAPQVQGPGAAWIGQAGVWVRLRGQMIDYLGLLAIQEFGEMRFIGVGQIATLDPHRPAQVRQHGWPAA